VAAAGDRAANGCSDAISGASVASPSCLRLGPPQNGGSEAQRLDRVAHKA
jgi:hypothetical protein